jgi:hypothetical protein
LPMVLLDVIAFGPHPNFRPDVMRRFGLYLSGQRTLNFPNRFHIHGGCQLRNCCRQGNFNHSTEFNQTGLIVFADTRFKIGLSCRH